MVAAPQYATATFIADSGRTISVDMYISDVAAALVRFGIGGGASTTSPTEWKAPVGCRLRDIIIVTGLTDTTKLQVNRNNASTGDILRYSLFDDGLATRGPLNIPFVAGDMLTLTQLA